MEVLDSYEHIDSNVVYTIQNIPTSATEHEYYQQINCGCICDTQCNEENSCSCREKSGAAYTLYKSETNDVHDAYIIHQLNVSKPIYECNNMCKCYGKNCGNRLIQYGPRNSLKIIKCPNNKGMGLVTTNKIYKGSFICEYAGEIISEAEANIRYTYNQQANSMNYIFCINEYFGNRQMKTFIDPSKFGNIGRYINHSCEPNCKVIPIRVNNIIPHICIFALKDIKPDSELTFDYGDGYLGFESIENSTNKKECLCNTKNCRKFLPSCS